MATFIKNIKIILLFFLMLTSSLSSCIGSNKENKQQPNDYSKNNNKEYDSTARKHKKHKHKKNKGDKSNSYAASNRSGESSDETANTKQGTTSIPDKVMKVLKNIKDTGHTFDNYVGGRKFGNYEGHLPKQDATGKKINYQEWDVNPKMSGQNRGTQRLVTGSDGKAYYSDDHYNSFTEIKK